jgi:hypothetical protein
MYHGRNTRCRRRPGGTRPPAPAHPCRTAAHPTRRVLTSRARAFHACPKTYRPRRAHQMVRASWRQQARSNLTRRYSGLRGYGARAHNPPPFIYNFETVKTVVSTLSLTRFSSARAWRPVMTSVRECDLHSSDDARSVTVCCGKLSSNQEVAEKGVIKGGRSGTGLIRIRDRT